ncbi:hypothetical protein AB0F13_19650 [Streptomyces sp. NPDC026206]|uniref:hypothetical protein n=1 Tax=Streptomyces sp. NPDC026206 TaxID=3157089 RepID=UPI0033DC7FCB
MNESTSRTAPITKPQRRFRARLSSRYLFTALMAALTLVAGTTTPASARTHDAKSSYIYAGGTGHWHVKFHGKASSENGTYTLTGTLEGSCSHAVGTAQPWMGLQYGSSSESWRIVEAQCLNSSKVQVKESGKLGSDGKLWIRAGGWGGAFAGYWGWTGSRILYLND